MAGTVIIKSLTVIAIVLVTVSVSNAEEHFIGNAKHADFPDKCWHEATKHAVAMGETYLPINVGECQKITCEDEFALRIESCSRYTAKPECVTPADYSKAYPACCPIVNKC